jgi:hypothetical protein
MIQLYSLMWILAVFFGIFGFLRGWNREVVATAGIVLGTFALFQFDPLIRNTLLLSFPRGQVYVIQNLIFLAILFFAYQGRAFNVGGDERNLQTGILGAVLGFFNGYLIGGSLWYLMDINEYPFAPYIVAPAPGSPSEQSLNSIPLVILSGGVGGSGDLLVVAVVLLIVAVVLLVL